jgi:hypothetical protein
VNQYLLNTFLYTVDPDPELVERYREDPAGTVTWWEAEQANRVLNCIDGESSTWLRFDDIEREAPGRPRLSQAVRAGRASVPDGGRCASAYSSATTSRWGSRRNTPSDFPT